MAVTIDSLNSQLSNIVNDIYNRRQRNNALQAEINELQKAYDKLGNIKKNNQNNANRIKNEAKLNKLAGGVAWKGQSKKDFDNVVNNEVKNAVNEFYNSIDRMQDEIGRIIGQKKGELDSGIGAINWLNRRYNDVYWQIRNWGN